MTAHQTELRRQETVKSLGLPSQASWKDIAIHRDELRRRETVKSLGLESDATWKVIGAHQAEQRRQETVKRLGLPPQATFEAISDHQTELRRNILGLAKSPVLEFPTLKSYLDWRDGKRVEYKMVADDLRALRSSISTTMRRSSLHINAERAEATAKNRQARWLSMRIPTVSMQHSQIFLRTKATIILKDRRAAKVIAGVSYQKWQESNQPK
jgi:hypothetical protein